VYGAGGVTTGTAAAQSDPTAMWSLTGSYAPTVPEVLIVIGVISLGVLGFMVLSNMLLGGKTAAQAV
jgi:molybdopterin-containing oxidoreductase family membrane subunit